MINPELIEIAKGIESAFADIPYPGDDNIVERLIVDGREMGDPEREEIADAFRGKPWRDLPREVILYHYDSLPFLTLEAFRYYLPAYLITALNEDGLNRDFVVFNLNFPERCNGFSPQQKLAVRAFLEYVRRVSESTGDPLQKHTTTALDRYWGQ